MVTWILLVCVFTSGSCELVHKEIVESYPECVSKSVNVAMAADEHGFSSHSFCYPMVERL